MRPGMRRAFGVVTIVILLGVLGLFFLLSGSPRPEGTLSPQPIDQVVTHRLWRETVIRQISTLSDGSSGDEIKKVRESLMGQTVTAGDRDAHASIVIDLLAWERGTEGAGARVKADVAQLPQ